MQGLHGNQLQHGQVILAAPLADKAMGLLPAGEQQTPTPEANHDPLERHQNTLNEPPGLIV